MRRTCLKAALAVLALGAVMPSVQAENAWPNRPMRLVVPIAAGSSTDVLARTLAEQLGKELKQTIIVENKPGANGAIAVNYLKTQPSDGYTMFLAGVSNMAWNPFLYKQLTYDPLKDLDGVAVFADTQFLTLVSPKFGVKNFGQLKELIQKNPGKYTFTSAGVGNSTHLSTELIRKRVGLQMEHAPFNGSGGITSVMAGDTMLMTIPPGGISETVKSGKLVAVAVTGDQRLKTFPDVPTYKELGYDVAVPGWYSIVVKKGTSPQIITKLNQAINQVLQSTDMKTRMEAQLLNAVISQPSDVKTYTERDTKAWGPLINELGIQK